jgi:hypothetical protein
MTSVALSLRSNPATAQPVGQPEPETNHSTIDLRLQLAILGINGLPRRENPIGSSQHV